MHIALYCFHTPIDILFPQIGWRIHLYPITLINSEEQLVVAGGMLAMQITANQAIIAWYLLGLTSSHSFGKRYDPPARWLLGRHSHCEG